MNYERLNVLRRPLAVLLGLMATYALVHFVFNSLYDENSLMLDILGYIMAVGATLFVVLTYIHRRSSEEPNLGAACAFYAAVILAILFFGNWIGSLNDYVHLSEQTTNNVWTVTDIMFVVGIHGECPPLATGSSQLSDLLLERMRFRGLSTPREPETPRGDNITLYLRSASAYGLADAPQV